MQHGRGALYVVAVEEEPQLVRALPLGSTRDAVGACPGLVAVLGPGLGVGFRSEMGLGLGLGLKLALEYSKR